MGVSKSPQQIIQEKAAAAAAVVSAPSPVTNTAASNSTLFNPLKNLPPQTEQEKEYSLILTNLFSILATLGTCFKEYDEVKSFIEKGENAPYLSMALKTLGKYPVKNRPNSMPCSFWSCWTETHCDYQEMLEFYIYAKLAKKYPILEKNTKNCNIIKEALVALSAEKDNETTLHGLDSAQVKAVISKISEYNSLNASLTCDDFLIDEQKREDAAAAKKKEDDAAKKFKAAYKDVTNTGGDTKKYITYGAVGLAAVVFLVVLVKKLKK